MSNLKNKIFTYPCFKIDEKKNYVENAHLNSTLYLYNKIIQKLLLIIKGLYK